MNNAFSTKAGTLAKLYGALSSARVLPQVTFLQSKYKTSKNEILNEIALLGQKVIVRSSALFEDTLGCSNAGKYISVPWIDSADIASLSDAIETVMASYGDVEEDNEVLVQPMLDGVSASGVVMSADQDTLSAYLVVNIDFSGKTDGVTSGMSEDIVTWIALKNAKLDGCKRWQQSIISACAEIEEFFGENALDIEFAFCGDVLYILQVRPIVKTHKKDLSALNLSVATKKLSQKIEKLSKPHPMLLGSRAVFGVMPDWNPAEIIGTKPRKLALSLYKELVTDSVWAYQRDNYGYRALRSHPLMMSFLGVPYIDVRVSFNSFVPKSLDDKIASKLVDYYLNKLVAASHYHDKVEFAIVFSCFTLDLNERVQVLLEHGFDSGELELIEKSLLELTKKVIDPKEGLYLSDIKKIDELEKKYALIMESDLALIDKIYWLVEECKRFGTLPFAGIARAAFMATQFLDSFVSLGIIDDKEKSLFLRSLHTVSSALLTDLDRYFDALISRDEFLQKYGHLRPGTYDILSSRYDEAFDIYFSSKPESDAAVEFRFSDEQVNMIACILKGNGLGLGFDEIIGFIKSAIEAREYSKFVFTKTLSRVLLLIEEFGKRFGFSRDELSYIDIQDILSLYSSLESPDVANKIRQSIDYHKKEYDWTLAVKLPSLIVSPKDVYSFFLEKSEPNFISQMSVTAETLLFDLSGTGGEFDGKIVFIKNADPGYDFLFSKNISGLVTCYGGANSHMAIRAGELGLPAVIGAGEKLFDIWRNAKVLELDCVARVVRVVS